MLFGLGLIALLLAVGGFAAYQGDRVGRLAGRRRLRLFGLRPRYTSRIITVITGVMIVSITLVSLLLVSENMRQALFGMDELRATVSMLTNDVSSKNEDLISLETQRSQLSDDIALLQQDNSNLQALNTRWKEENKALAAENIKLESERGQLEQERKLLEQSTQLLRALGSDIYDTVSQLRQAEITYRRGDILGTCVIDATLPLATIQLQLQQFVLDTSHKLQQAGSNKALRLEVRIPEQGIVGTDVLIEAAAHSIKEDPYLQSVIVQLRVQENTVVGEDVFADFELVRNVRVYKEGDEVCRHTFAQNDNKAALFEELFVFISVDIRNAVSRKGLLSGNYSGEVTVSEAYSIVDEIAASKGPVQLVAMAHKDCWTAELLQLEFKILPAPIN